MSADEKLNPQQFLGHESRRNWKPIKSTNKYVQYSAPVDDLRRHEVHQGTYRDFQDQDELRASIAKEGVRRPLTVDADPGLGVMDGHHRLRNAAAAGLTHVPVRVYQHGDDRERAMNRDSRAGHKFYTSDIRATAEAKKHKEYLASDEYKATEKTRQEDRRGKAQKRIDWLRDRSEQLHAEGNHDLGVRAGQSADAAARRLAANRINPKVNLYRNGPRT